MKSLITAIVFLVTTPAVCHAEWELVWSDEFNYEGLPDRAKWGYEKGFVRNEEAQYYTGPDDNNAWVENGILVIEARKEIRQNPAYDPTSHEWRKSRQFVEYTSASLTTQNTADWTYGRFEFRAELPQGKGVWPGVWTLGTNITRIGWPACGEVDIMEFVARDPKWVHVTIHYALDMQPKLDRCILEIGKPFTGFHVYAMEWYPDRMDFFFDDEKIHTFLIEKANDGAYNPYHNPQYLLISLALGGSFGGPIDDAALPQRFLVDYVRVYREKGSQPPLTPP
jgi:beta-glucanase (GH16 family)